MAKHEPDTLYCTRHDKPEIMYWVAHLGDWRCPSCGRMAELEYQEAYTAEELAEKDLAHILQIYTEKNQRD